MEKRFREITWGDLQHIYSWLDERDYLRREGFLENMIYRGLAYGVDVDGNIEAIGIIYPVDSLAWLMGARVRSDMRRKGIGRFMTEKLIEEAKERGFREVALLTSKYNTPVHKISESLGMRRILQLVSIGFSHKYTSVFYTFNKKIIYLHNDDKDMIFRNLIREYPLLPLSPGGGVWGLNSYVLDKVKDELYVCGDLSSIYAISFSGCSWIPENNCRNSLGIIFVDKEDMDLLRTISCISETSLSEDSPEIIVWLREDVYDNDFIERIESLGRWSWRSYIYYMDL